MVYEVGRRADLKQRDQQCQTENLAILATLIVRMVENR